MKKLSLFLSLSLLVLSYNAFTQGCPSNIDFEIGDFSNWNCATGITTSNDGKNLIDLNPSRPIFGIHEIITEANDTKDPYGNFPTLCPYGGQYSVKLGNEQYGAQAEGLSYTFIVPSNVDTFTFTYFYAVVFQDPGHKLEEQPRFFVTAYDVLSGDLINCASYDYVATSGLPGFKKSTYGANVLYKEWSPVSIQFAGLANREVRLEFKTADCTLGGHFGYAYVDVGTGCSNIMATAPYCVETNSIVLNAPYGFKDYTWYNSDFTAVVGNQQTLTLSPPPATSGTYFVDIVPYPGFGCRDTASAVVIPLPVPDTPVANPPFFYCLGGTTSPLVAKPLKSHDLLWYTSASGGTGNNTAPSPPTTALGTQTYYVSQKKLFGCESFRKEVTAIIGPTPVSSFNINSIRQCEGDEFIFTSTSTQLDNNIFIWQFGDGKTDTSSSSVMSHTYKGFGNFDVKLKVLNQPVCFDEKVQRIIAVPKPLAKFSYPFVICEDQTNISFKDLSQVPGGLSSVNKWWWDINGSESNLRFPDAFIPTDPNKLSIRLVVETPEGCRSDTGSAILPVHYKPAAAFRYTRPLCDNEIMRFTNFSSLPQEAAGEFVTKWYWQIDNTSTTAQHPSFDFDAGVKHVKLIAETNFGCYSDAADSILTINPKPNIRLTINDSCVLRSINYKAEDLNNTVSNWKWDFGNGFSTGPGLISRTYTYAGPQPLILLAETVHGCRDTVIRPFSIYANKAFAGRDTIVAKGEPVQLHAHGGPNMVYTWSPATGLSSPSIENPVAILDRDQQYTLLAVTTEGCDSYSKIFIKRYQGPELYIPNAFTPNGDGLNDALRVFPVGIREFGSLSIYNRYGQLIFQTSDYHKGWDGTLNGTRLSSGNFVAVAKAIDYKGNVMLKKENVVLIR